MTQILQASTELAGLAAMCGLVLAIALVMRNPFAPALLRSEVALQTTSFVLVALIAVAIALATSSLLAVGLGFLATAATVLATLIGAPMLFWTAFGVGHRLRRAEAGHSPFARVRPAASPLAAPTPA